MKQSRISIAKTDIAKHFESLPQNIFRRADIEKILSSEREFWRLTKSLTINEFINFLLKETKLKKFEFPFPHRKEIRYVWGEAPFFELLMNLKKECFFSHYTAMFFHGLTEQTPNTIYLNVEQKKPQSKSGSGLTQQGIDSAFKRKVRVSKNIAKADNKNICILNSMGIDRLGVIDFETESKERVQLTNIERTLIDIAVRPIYSGGVFEVLNAYKLASGRFSINRLSAMLKKINYVYPYHQVIGYYLEKSGKYDDDKINFMRKPDIKYDFYLTHDMQDQEYSKKWKLFIPKGF